MAQQTGSISFEATNAVHLSAEGQYESLSDDLRDNYYTKSEFTVAPDKILSTVKEHSEQSARPNLTPWFSVSVDDISYWAELHARNTSVSNSEGLHGIWDGEDGWAHVTLDSRTSAGNDGSKNCYMNMHVAHPKIADKVTAGGKYTWLIEVRNLTLIAGASGDALYVRPSVNNATLDVFNTCSKAFTEDGAQWGVVTAKSDLSVLTTKDARGYCYIHTGCYADFDLRISLYEGEYEGPYKPYVDQSLITRVSTAETAIEQNAEAITLRATKTEAQQMAQPNLSPWFSLQPIENDTEHWNINNGNTTFTPLEDGWVHLHNDNSSGTGVKRTDYQVMGSPSVTPGADYTWLFEYRNNNSTGNNQNYIVQSSERVQFWGNNVVKVLEGKSGGATTTLGPNQDFPPGTDGVYVKRVLKKAEAATSSHLDRTGTLYLGCLVCYAYAGAVADYDLRVSIYEGEYTGPYKPYSGAQLYASQAELKVANDAISSKVSKTDYNGQTVASLINQSADSVKIEAQHVEIDGTAIFTAIKGQADAAYDAKGAASAVQDNLDNLAIGGTNLLGGTANPSSKQVVMNSAATSTFGDVSNYNDDVSLYSFEDFDGYSNALKWTTSATGNRGAGWYTKVGAIKAGERYTFSCKVMSSVATTVHTHTAWRNGSATAGYVGWTSIGSVAIPANEWVDYSHSFVPSSSANLDWEFYVALCFSGNSGGATFRVAHAKLEHGNRATDWGPAPEDHTDYVDSSIDGIQVGGRNLLLGTADWSKWTDDAGTTISGDEATYTANNVSNRLAPFAVTPGETYTISVDIKADRAYTYGTTGNTFLLLDYSEADGYHRVTSVWIFYGTKLTTEWQRVSETFTVPTTATIAQLYVSLRNAGSNPPTYTLRHMKVEKGNKATDWTPAPEDIEANAVKRTQRIYYRTSSSTAPTSQYMPSAWVTETGDKWSASSTVTSNWTTKVTPIQDLSNASSVKCLYLFTCEQREMADGTIAYTNVLLDESTTVIDGGNVITHSIDADAINVSSIAIGDLDGASTVVSNAANGKSAYDRHTAYRGTCSTAAGTAAKVVTCTGFALATGATVEVYCSTANTANVPTLNVNSTGAKAVWINGAVASASNPCKWLAGDTVTFTYDGTRFRASLPVEGYVTEGTGGGLMVHRKSDATTGVQITDSVEILQGGTSVAEYGATARIGESTKAHVEIEEATVKVKGGDDTFVSLAPQYYSDGEFTGSGVITLRSADGENTYLYSMGISAHGQDQFFIHALKDSSAVAVDDYYGAQLAVGVGAGNNALVLEVSKKTESGGQINRIFTVDPHGAVEFATPLADSNLPTKGSAGTAGTSSATSGATLAVPYVTTDAYGRVTAKGTHTHTIGSLAASAVSSGTFDAARIPNLDASKINAGTFDAARIPNLNASKINAGTLDSARLPTVPIGKGGTGQTGYSTVTSVASVISAASGVTITNIALVKWGYLCQLTLTVSPSAAKTSAWTAGTVVQAYRPAAKVTGRPYHSTVEAAQIATDGTLSVTACGANASIPVSFTYMLARSS